MTRRLALTLFVALFAASPLMAQTDQPPPDGAPVDEASPEIGDRVDRAEQGLLRGVIVLVDSENLIIETEDGDRAFSIRPASELPSELSDPDEWADAKGVPVSVAFVPGEEGELRVVERVTLLPPTTVSTTLPATPAEPAPETDLADQSDVVEPTEVRVTTEQRLTTTAPATGSGQEIADANPDEREVTTTALTADGGTPPTTDTLASLPATGSSLPRLALVGSLALLAALGLGRLEARRRRVTIVADRR